MSIHVTILKSNGLRGTYRQVTSKLATEVASRLNPRTLFTQGSLILGTGNPFTLINPGHISCIEVVTGLPLKDVQPPGVSSARLLPDQQAFMVELDQRWKGWRKQGPEGPGSLQEALLHLELAGGWHQYMHVTGRLPDRETERKVMENLLDLPVICIQRPGGGYNYINPANIVRMRIYHSNPSPFQPRKVLPLDPEEI